MSIKFHLDVSIWHLHDADAECGLFTLLYRWFLKLHLAATLELP